MTIMQTSNKLPTFVFHAYLLVMLLAMTLGPLHAQESLGQINGIVRDPSGAVVAGASISSTCLETGTTSHVQTNSAGFYALQALPVGTYRIKVEANGFRGLERNPVRVVSGEVVSLDLSLDIASSTQTLEVKEAGTLTDITNATAQTTRVVEEISDLPVIVQATSRNAISFLATFPGVPPQPGGNPNNNIGNTAINGTPAGAAGYYIDGVYGAIQAFAQANDYMSPPPEIVTEMNLNATNTPEFGWNDGVTLTVVTKSGSNSFHGELFEYFRNDAMDARNWFSATPSPNKQNEYGFTLGGPVVLPKFYNGKNRTFFFGMWSGYNYRSTPSGVNLTVPTALMKAGNFSEWLASGVKIYDPGSTTFNADGSITRTPFPNNIIPASRISSVSQHFQEGFPAPTTSGLGLNWTGSQAPSPVDVKKGLIKIDHYLDDGKEHISASYEHWRSPYITGGNWSGSLISTSWWDTNSAHRARLIYDASLTPSTMLSIRAGLNRDYGALGPLAESANGAAEAGLTGAFDPETPGVSISSLGSFGSPFNGHFADGNWTIPVNADLTMVRGNHEIKTGAAYLSNNIVVQGCFSCAGSLSFVSQTTGLPGAPTSGLGYASFLLGDVSTGSLSTPDGARYTSQAYGFYVQDHWRVTRKLSVSYGIRSDLFLSFHETYDRFSYFDATLPNPQAGGRPGALSFFGNGPGRNGYDSFANPKWAFSPYLGLAYALTPSTVIRASYGLSSSTPIAALTSGLGLPGTADKGWSWTGTSSALNGGLTPAFNWDTGFPLAPPTLPSLNPSIANNGSAAAWNRNDLGAGRTQNIYLGFETIFPGNVRIKAGYVGTLSHGLLVNGLALNQLNQQYLSLGSLLLQQANSPAAGIAGIAAPYPGFTGTVAQALLPYPQYQTVTDILSRTGFDEYNALQATAQKRYGNGLSLLAAYTWSKNLTNFNNGQGNGSFPLQNMSLLRNLKYLSQFDRTHMFVLSYRYEFPFGPGKRFLNVSNPIARQLVGGWTVAAIQQYMSGDPVVVTTSQTIPGNFGSIWANSVPGVSVVETSVGSYNPGSASSGRYLSSQAFTDPAPFTFGNIRVLNVRNPAIVNENVSLVKQFRFSERISGLVSADVSNLFNRHQWTGLQTNIDNPQTFGRFTAATSPRLIQLHIKVEF